MSTQPQPRPRKPTAYELRRERQKARERFLAGRRAESGYARRLRAVAKQVGELVSGLLGGGQEALARLRDTLEDYAQTLKPWAEKVAEKMVNEVSRRDKAAWEKHARSMGRTLAREIENAPTGETMRRLMENQVDLITSIPRRSAERVHQLVLKGIREGTRFEHVREEILKTGSVAVSRATLIARTETARAASVLTQARAEYVGSEEYIWRTAMDADVRRSHKALEGKTFRWDNPPVSEPTGERSHPGQIWNCRCVAEPILPDLV